MIEIKRSQKGTPFVLASDLHKELEIETPLAAWFPRMIDYGFEQDVDYYQFNENIKPIKGGVPADIIGLCTLKWLKPLP